MSTEITERVSRIFDKAKHEALAVILEAETQVTLEPRIAETSSTVEPYLNYKAAAEYMGVEVRTLKEWVAENFNNIPFRKAGTGVRFKRADLDEWTAANARSRLRAVKVS